MQKYTHVACGNQTCDLILCTNPPYNLVYHWLLRADPVYSKANHGKSMVWFSELTTLLERSTAHRQSQYRTLQMSQREPYIIAKCCMELCSYSSAIDHHFHRSNDRKEHWISRTEPHVANFLNSLWTVLREVWFTTSNYRESTIQLITTKLYTNHNSIVQIRLIWSITWFWRWSSIF